MTETGIGAEGWGGGEAGGLIAQFRATGGIQGLLEFVKTFWERERSLEGPDGKEPGALTSPEDLELLGAGSLA